MYVRICVHVNYLYSFRIDSIYAGHHSILIPPAELEINPTLWLSAVSQNKGKHVSSLYVGM